MAFATKPFMAGGTILQYRNGILVGDFGSSRISPADYGIGLLAAFAALQDGDELVLGPMLATCASTVTLAANGCKIYAANTCIKPSSNYDYIFRVTGNRNEVHGVSVDGGGTANTGAGYGIQIDGDYNRIIGCTSKSTVAALDYNGNSFRVNGATGTYLESCYSYDAHYAGIQLYNVNSTEIVHFHCVDPRNRSFSYNQDVGLTDLKCVIRGFRSLVTVSIPRSDGGASPYWDFNGSGTLKEAVMTDVNLELMDVISSGYSFDDTISHDLLKIQNVDKLVQTNVQLTHGQNLNGTYATRSMRPESIGFGDPPKEWICRNVVCSGGMPWGNVSTTSQRLEYVDWDGVVLGARANEEGTLVYYAQATEWNVRNSKFYCHDGNFCTVSEDTASTDSWNFHNNEFVFNKSGAGAQYMFTGSAAGLNAWAASAGNHVFAKNSITNDGSGTPHISNDQRLCLAMDTDAVGDMRFDDTKVGTGASKHPDPGASAPYFSSTLACPANGRRIWNINWSPDATQVVPEKGWIAHGGVWKEIT